MGSRLRADFLASIVVFLVALPLSMGVAIASGAPVSAGLLTAIIGGVVAGSLAGCPLQVSGPAAGLTVIVYEAIQQYGIERLGIIVLLAGLLQIVAGLIYVGQWFRAVSPAVVRGMLAGIGFLIIAGQFHVMIDDKPRGSGASNLISIPDAITSIIRPSAESDATKWPERSRALQVIGELHRRQLAIEERVLEWYHYAPANGEPINETAANALTQLAADQQQWHVDLNAAVANLDELVEPDAQTKSDSLSMLLRLQSDNALGAMRSGDMAASVKSQQELTLTLERELAALKSHRTAGLLGLITIVVIIFWESLAPRRLKFIPTAIVAVGIATVAAWWSDLPVLRVESPTDLWTEIHLPILNSSDLPWKGLLQSAMLIAVVASAETLLCAVAVDRMPGTGKTNYDRELVSQGVGNALCGIVGALPMTGVIVRSSVNVQAGAQSRLSSVLHGFWILVCVSLLGSVLSEIPTACLAAILVHTGYKLVDIKAVRELVRFGWSQVAIYAITVGTIVFEDLLTGVIVGIALSVGHLLFTLAHLSIDMQIDSNRRSATLSLHGAASFIRLPYLATALEQVPPDFEVCLDFENTQYIDHACLELLASWAKQHESIGGAVSFDWHAAPHGVSHLTRLMNSPTKADH